MEEINNPYIAGAPVTEKRMFFGREDVFDWVERSLSGHILVVHGQRRVGKTSVLKQLGNHLPDRYIPILFDLQGRTNTTLDRFMWWLASGIVRALKQERDITIAPPDRDLFARDPDYFENRFLPDLSPQLGKDKVLLLTFDEFDNLEEGEVKNSLARPLIDQLRRLMEQSNLNFIFSIGSSGRKLENMQAAYTEFFKAALYRKISFLTKDDGQRLITLPVQGIIEYEKDAVQQIYEIVSGHPYFTQLVCHELFSLCQKTGQHLIKCADVDGILDDVVERGTVNLKFVWDEAVDLEKWALSGLAQLEGKRNNRALADFLSHQRVRFNQQALDSALLHLREKDVLTEDNRFVNQLLQIWMKKNRPIEQAREELTEVNPIANRYIEIGLEFKHSQLYDKAVESFKEALEIDSDNLQAQVSLALVYLDQKNVEKAIAEFEKALAIDDEDIATRSGLCDAYLAQGDQARAMARPREADAIKAYQKILAINGEHNEARQRMAEVNRQRAEKALVDGKDEEALSAFTEALKYTPDDPSLIERVDQVRTEKKAKVLAAQIARSEKEVAARNWEKAIAALNEALETSPGDETILKKIALIKERQLKERLDAILVKADQAEKAGRWDTTIAALNEYLNLRPDDAAIQKRITDIIEARHTAWLNAIITRADQAVTYQKWDEAISVLNEVLTLESDNTEIQKKVVKVREARHIAELNALLKRVETAVQAGRWDDAINDLNNGVASEPENETLRSKLIEVRKAKREARLKAAMRLVDSATQAGNWDTAIEVLNETLAIEPENETLQSKLAEVQKAKREARLKAALRSADNATQAGNWDAAIEVLNDVIVTEPENAEFQRKLAEVKEGQRESRLNSLRTQARGLARAEKYKESLAAWNEYLALDPDDREKAQAEIESVKKAQSLANTYAEAYNAYSKKNYEKAIGLFKGVVVEDTDYKDATRLLAESIELRRTTYKWWQSKLLWGSVGSLAVLAIGWFALKPRSPLMNALLSSTAAPITTDASATSVPGGSPATEIPALLPTATPTPLPFSWARLNSGQFLPRDQVTAVVFDPTDPGVIYVGMENAGIYKSIDGGSSWQPAYSGLERANVSTLVIDPREPSTLYVGVVLGGIYKTTDGAKTWRPINSGIELPGGEWLSIVVMDPQNNKHLYFTHSSGLYESLDEGETWQKMNIPACMASGGISNLAMHPNDGKTVFITEFNGGDTFKCPVGIYKSEDGGGNWTQIPITLTEKEFTNKSLTIDSRNPNNIFFSEGGKTLNGSFDGGNTWKKLMDGGCSTIAFDPANQNRTYCGGSAGLQVSNSSESRWSKVNIPDALNVTAIAFSPLAPKVLLAGEAGLYISQDEGKTWNTQNSGLGGSIVQLKIDPANASTLYGEGNDAKTYISTDNGRTWSQSQTDTSYLNPTVLSLGQCEPLGYLSSDGQTGYGVGCMAWDSFRTNDGGKTWDKCGGGDNVNEWVPRSLTRLSINPRDNKKLIIALRGNGILMSENGCQSWQFSNDGLGSLFVNSVAIDPNNPNNVYAGTDGGAYVSTDSGQTWGQVNDGLLGATVMYSIVVDKDSNVYAATPYGIFKLEGK
jgi:tetratricopeptide (TPR) repeat protein/photosystem II stability/assembly factor-like uncharacterized protein